MSDARDKEKNPENKRTEDFQKDLGVKEIAMEFAKKLLISVTEDEFSKLGYEAVDKSAGEYGTGEKYGVGVEQNKYNVRVAGKSNASLEKQTLLGTERVQSDINFQYNGKMVSVEYKTTENGAFRGVDSKGIPYSFKETISVDGTNKKELESAMKKLFTIGAKKEIGYLTNTRLGVDDKLDQGTASTVNENDMKKLTIKNIFLGDDIFEESLSDKLKAKNTIPAEKVHPYIKSKNAPKNKYLMFDEEGLNERAEASEIGKEAYLETFKNELKKLGATKLSELTPAEKKTLFEKMDTITVSKDEKANMQNEITTAGPAGSGAGAFLTPYAFKATPYNQYKGKSKPKITKEYNVVPNTENYNGQFWQKVDVNLLKDTHPQGMPGVKPGSQEELNIASKGLDKNKLRRLGLKENEEKASAKAKPDLTKKKMFSTSENEAKGINKRYLVTEKTSAEYLKERWNKLTNFKLYESINEELEIEAILGENNIIATAAQEVTLKECFGGGNENDSKFTLIKRRYDQATAPVRPFQRDLTPEEKKALYKAFGREHGWSKPDARGHIVLNGGMEERGLYYITLDDLAKLVGTTPTPLQESDNLEETVTVKKPGSIFGIEYVFYKKDFLNEDKKYILDLSSRVFVPNPNTDKKLIVKIDPNREK